MLVSFNYKTRFFCINTQAAVFLIAFLCFISSAWADDDHSFSDLAIKNLQHPAEHTFTSGQPSQEAFSALAKIETWPFALESISTATCKLLNVRLGSTLSLQPITVNKRKHIVLRANVKIRFDI